MVVKEVKLVLKQVNFILTAKQSQIRTQLKQVRPTLPMVGTNYTPDDADFVRKKFSLTSGYKPPLNSKPESDLEFFQLFFTNELIKEITNETNRYAAEKIGAKRPFQQHSVWENWKDVSTEEMKVFLM